MKTPKLINRQHSNDLSESQIKQLQNNIIKSQSYKLAYVDTELLASDDLRQVVYSWSCLNLNEHYVKKISLQQM